jgi:hypothetical protein
MQNKQILTEMLETMRRIETLLATANSQRGGMKPAGDLRSPPARPIERNPGGKSDEDQPPTPHDSYEHRNEARLFKNGFPYGRCKGKILSDCNSGSLRHLIGNSDPEDPKWGESNRAKAEMCQAELDRRSGPGAATPGKFRGPEPMPKRSEPMPPIDLPENEEDQIPF